MKQIKTTVAFCLILAFALYAVGCASAVGGGSDDTRTVLTFGNREVIADTYRYFYLTHGMELARAAGWEFDVDTKSGEIEALAKDSLGMLYRTYVLADHYDFSLSDERCSEIDVAVAEEMASIGGEETYYELCDAYYMTGDLFRLLSYESAYLENDLYTYLVETLQLFPTDYASVKQDVFTNFYHCSQILIPFSDTVSKDRIRADAEKVLERIRSGEKTFLQCAKEYKRVGEDPEKGAYYTKGQALLAFEEAALALKVGAMSGLVETDAGYHIILRMEIKESEIEAQIEDLRALYLGRSYTELLEEARKGIVFAHASKYEDVLEDLQTELSELIATEKAATTKQTGGEN